MRRRYAPKQTPPRRHARAAAGSHRRQPRPRRISRRTFLLAGAAAIGTAVAAVCCRQPRPAAPAPTPSALPVAGPPLGYRAVWISYLEWQGMDFTSEQSFRAQVAQQMENCAALGLNTVIAQVRPFGDALYASNLFPWSHCCTGVQGRAPGFDPLDVLVAEAHAQGLALEAWINPYRLRASAASPAQLAENSLACTHPEWCVEAGGGLYLNPAIPAAADYVVRGVQEILERYAVDGIHFDDYFYPATDPALDAAQFAASGMQDLGAFRRQNVTALVRAVYKAVKAADPTLRFGISPQGNPDNNYSQQYSDTAAWLAAGGEEQLVDYLCPQLYWGYHYRLQSGSERFAFENILREWLAMPRAAAVALYFGLGAWRIGEGDGGANPDSASQWSSGCNLASQAAALLEQNAQGYALYRYNSLFASAWPELAAAEAQALAGFNRQL